MISPAIRYSCKILGVLFLTMGSSSYAASPDQTGITRVSITERSDKTGYVLRLHSDKYIQAFSPPREAGDDRYELTVFNTDVSTSIRKDDPSGPISTYNLTTRDGHTVFRFTVLPGMKIDASAYRDRDTNDLLVGLIYSSGDSQTTETIAARPLQPVENDGPSVGARNRWRLDTIVIDAGHGGKDPGTSKHGVREKDVTLAVAKKVGAYLEEYLKVNVIYTRDDDRFIDLKKRGEIANKAGGKLFVSIHADAQARGSSANGATMYILGTHKTKAAREAMERENSVVSFEADQSAYSGINNQSIIMQTLAQSSYMRQSEQLASLLEKQFAQRANRKTRGVKQAGFWVLWHASMPAVLIELGFVTNRGDARYMDSELGQTYLASAIYRAIRDYKFEYEKELSLTTSQ
ncbi:MAG: N-acetylmuramoyl-L-alanine amidase [Rhodothermales bacterium]|nr:N-acetylmuramoyl-L-alanine amidase [Rhodothermales bacterium]